MGRVAKLHTITLSCFYLANTVFSYLIFAAIFHLLVSSSSSLSLLSSSSLKCPLQSNIQTAGGEREAPFKASNKRQKQQRRRWWLGKNGLEKVKVHVGTEENAEYCLNF